MAHVNDGFPTSIRIGTWNVRECVPKRPCPDVIGELTSLVRDMRLDVLSLQEVPFSGSGSPLLALQDLDCRLPYVAEHVLSVGMHGSPSSGLALVSRFPLESVTRTLFPNPCLRLNGLRSFDKGVMTAAIAVGGRSVRVAGVHVFPFHRFGRRAEEDVFAPIWDLFGNEVAKQVKGPVFVAGDLNTRRRDLIPPRIVALDSAVRAGVDDILYGAGAQLISVDIVPGFSDHNLCVAEFELP
ncbi:endonuclease/exonuclease/phosphatase family protein [Microbispora sp. H10836]|uniref:endonuclease/exonuclease/phosphatase family protein n=1 Tax=Microbispora sp. H10836 TaxID=2729106 RepID=UPI0020163F53|nr:endonuclease/exonuclease/phosphatase family protein [Microbispora sp. H10836]